MKLDHCAIGREPWQAKCSVKHTQEGEMTRIETLEKVFGPGKGRTHLRAEEIREGLASFYYDLTAATSPAQLFGLQRMEPPPPGDGLR